MSISFQMKPTRGYPVDYENINMSSLLEGLEEIIGTHDGSCDSGIQASPQVQASYFQGNYNKQQPRARESGVLCYFLLDSQRLALQPIVKHALLNLLSCLNHSFVWNFAQIYFPFIYPIFLFSLLAV